jgi:transcriptional regulator with XRE-family HTH domain
MQAAKNLIDNLQEQIENRMHEKNLNARELERRAGLKISAVRNILSGQSKNPGIEVIAAIAKLLNCSTDELLGLEQEKNKAESTKQKIITIWDYSLYENCLKEVHNYLSQKNAKPQAEQILFFIREAYIYSLEGKDKKADLRFIKWIIDSHC